MAPPTLMSMAQRNLIRNLPNLQDVGDTPYVAVKPALRKILDPQQLRNIETASPHIADADGELWIAFIKRDIPNWKDKMVTPKNPRSWWKVYRKLYREEQAAQEEQQKQLKEALMKEKREKEEHQTNILGTAVQQRFRQAAMVDGKINPKAGSYGLERVGSVANAKKSGKNIISAIRKAATKPSHFRAPVNTNVEGTAPKMWRQTATPPSGVRRKDPPNALYRGPPKMAQTMANLGLDKALKEGERIKKQKAERTSNSPPPSWATEEQAQSPPKRQPAVPASVKPTRATSPAVPNKIANSLGPGAGVKRTLSPANASPAPPQKRQRPATSIFMPKRIKR